jgi:hypothetical protein
LAAFAAKWTKERLVEIWNSLPGVEPIQVARSPKAMATKIWARIQNLGETPADSAQAATGAPAKGKATKKATPAAKPAKGAKSAKSAKKAKEPAAAREGSKTAQVVAMLQRKNGATLQEIMTQMGWQRHTVRGFMAGAMKKAGYAVESFKPEGGERTYRINA